VSRLLIIESGIDIFVVTVSQELTMGRNLVGPCRPTLSAADVERILGIVGGSLNGFPDTLYRYGAIHWLHVRQEEAAAFAAGAAAQVTGGSLTGGRKVPHWHVQIRSAR
jgi:thiamine pyrophosphate-dependent enzyme